MKNETPTTDKLHESSPLNSEQYYAMSGLELALNELRKTATIVAEWLERSSQINPADMVSRNNELARELRMTLTAMPNGQKLSHGHGNRP